MDFVGVVGVEGKGLLVGREKGEIGVSDEERAVKLNRSEAFVGGRELNTNGLVVVIGAEAETGGKMIEGAEEEVGVEKIEVDVVANRGAGVGISEHIISSEDS